MSTLPDILTFDLETTGVDPHGDRVVQAFLGLMDSAGNWVQTGEWILNPGVPVPDGAAEVHGFTTERLQVEGRTDLQTAFYEIASTIHRNCVVEGLPLVIYNAPFDTTFLNAELRRHGLTELPFGEAQEPGSNPHTIRILDPLVIDKGIDKYRRGSRKLVDVAPFYGVPVEANAHDAGADCLMAGRVALRQLERESHGVPLLGFIDRLQRSQVRWKAEQASSLQAYFRSPKAGDKQDPNIIINGEWPIQSTPTTEGIAA